MLALALLIAGVSARFLPHAPNFSPVIAIAVFGGVYLRRSQALWLPLVLMMTTDLFLGLHATVPFTWGSVFLCSLIGLWARRNPQPLRLFSASLASAIVFFAITNFGSWFAFYPLTREGLIACYTLAIPFFRWTVASTVLYSFVLFGLFELVARRVKGTQ